MLKYHQALNSCFPKIIPGWSPPTALRQTFRQVTLVASNFSGWNWNVTWGRGLRKSYPSSHNHGSGKWVPPIFVSFHLGWFSTSMILGERVTHPDPCWIFLGEWVWRNQFKWILKMRVVTSKHVKTPPSPGLLEHFRGALQFSWGNLLHFFCLCVCVYIWIESWKNFTTCHIKPFIVGDSVPHSPGVFCG